MALQREVEQLKAERRPKPARVDDDRTAEREAAKNKREEERAAAKREHAEAASNLGIRQLEKDKTQADWLAKEKERRREQVRISAKKWRAAHPEKARIFRQAWESKNRERAAFIRKRWRAANPEKNRAYFLKYKAKKHGQS